MTILNNAVGPTNIQIAKIQLSSLQIKSLYGTPQVIVPAQGANTIIVPISFVAKYIYGGSNVFVAGASQNIRLTYRNVAGGGFQAATVIMQDSALQRASNCWTEGVCTYLDAELTGQIDNVPIAVANFISTEISGNAANDNILNVYLMYYVWNLI